MAEHTVAAQGHDKSPERNRLIFGYTAIAVAILVVLGFVFKSYFTLSVETQRQQKVLTKPNEQLRKVVAENQKELRTGPMPINRAIRELVHEGRRAAPAIKPKPSDDRAALEGWSFSKRKRAEMGGFPAPRPGTSDAGRAEGDAGAAATDAAAAGTEASEGGTGAGEAETVDAGTAGADAGAKPSGAGGDLPRSPNDTTPAEAESAGR